MSVANPLLLIFLLLGVIYAAFYRPFIKPRIEWIIAKIIALPDAYKPILFSTLIRVVKLNWYTCIMIAGLGVLLFGTDVGGDVVEMYLNNLAVMETGDRFLALIYIFFSTFLMSLSIWCLPFFLFSKERLDEISKNSLRFYMSTKTLAFLAMLPFIIITNAFVYHGLQSGDFLSFSSKQANRETHFLAIKIIVINIVVLVLFLSLTAVSVRPKIVRIFSRLYKFPFFTVGNGYYTILIRISFWTAILAVIASLFLKIAHTNYFVIVTYLFLTSTVAFRLLFYSKESADTTEKNDEKVLAERIAKLVADMLSMQNKGSSRAFYWPLLILLLLLVLYYYAVPSLEATNPLYILLVVFAFYIIYLDLWRHVYRNCLAIWKAVALFSTILLVSTPFLTPHNQFRVGMFPMASTKQERPNLNKAFQERLRYIHDSTGDSVVYIVCAMGGGSRAGYITAGVLQKIDSIDPSFWKKTLCYSTVSGGSVGTYTYIKSKEYNVPPNDIGFLRAVYNKNYNSCGVFGFLCGDGLESVFGRFASLPREILAQTPSSFGFYDRNERIRQEYDFVLHKVVKKPQAKDGYLQRTFYPYGKDSGYAIVDSFKTYFQQRIGKIPIHLINTFEVSTGRRAILSPFSPGSDTFFFPNAMLPLQDERIESCADKKDITYRAASNMSELFPLISAASHIGKESEFQFVDGGYFENYGLETAYDIIHYLVQYNLVKEQNIRVLLIKNSEQEAGNGSENIQLIAPLIGAMNAPFTGHANHLLEEGKKRFGANLYALTFPAKQKKVPLTRSLTAAHIDSMNTFLWTVRTNDTLRRLIRIDQTQPDTTTHPTPKQVR